MASSNEQAPGANRALLLISAAVLLASSTWFSGTAAVAELQSAWDLAQSEAASLTTSVQLGFIVGTVVYAALNLADVFNPRGVFFVSALLGAGFNAGFGWSDGLQTALALRFATGVTLAGIYPVGMKIVATWFRAGLGWRLGVLVGALTLGTSVPYLLQALGADLGWRPPVLAASGAAVIGGLVVRFSLRDGPFLRARAPFDLRMASKAFAHPPFRRTALGYFGHMWELYAVWALIGFYLDASFLEGAAEDWNRWVAWLSFAVVAMGAVGCVGGGWLSRTLGERRVALGSLLASATLCLLSGVLFALPPLLLVPLLLLWGIVVVSDSPQFSALAALHAPPGYTGTALTVQNGIGFAITIGSIQLTPWVAGAIGWRWAFVALAIGPLLGAWAIHTVSDSTTTRDAVNP